MITESSIYWITRLDYIRDLLLLVPLGLTALLLLWVWFKAYLDDEINGFSVFSALFICVFLFGLGTVIRCFIPTTKEMIAIKVIPQIANGVQKHEIPELALRYVNEWLKEETEKYKK